MIHEYIKRSSKHSIEKRRIHQRQKTNKTLWRDESFRISIHMKLLKDWIDSRIHQTLIETLDRKTQSSSTTKNEQNVNFENDDNNFRVKSFKKKFVQINKIYMSSQNQKNHKFLLNVISNRVRRNQFSRHIFFVFRNLSLSKSFARVDFFNFFLSAINTDNSFKFNFTTVDFLEFTFDLSFDWNDWNDVLSSQIFRFVSKISWKSSESRHLFFSRISNDFVDFVDDIANFDMFFIKNERRSSRFSHFENVSTHEVERSNKRKKTIASSKHQKSIQKNDFDKYFETCLKTQNARHLLREISLWLSFFFIIELLFWFHFRKVRASFIAASNCAILTLRFFFNKRLKILYDISRFSKINWIDWRFSLWEWLILYNFIRDFIINICDKWSIIMIKNSRLNVSQHCWISQLREHMN